MLVSADARVEPRLDIRADVRPAFGYSDSGLFGSSVLWALLSTWCGAEVCMLGRAYVVATNAWRASYNKKKRKNTKMVFESQGLVGHSLRHLFCLHVLA